MRNDGLPRRVYIRHGAFYYASPTGRWHWLARVEDGETAMYRALVTVSDSTGAGQKIPGVAARWLVEARKKWTSAKQISNMERAAARVSAAFADFHPQDVRTVTCAEFLMAFRDRPRTHNVLVVVLRGVLAKAAQEGLRDGANPMADVGRLTTRPRRRPVTDAEVAATRDAAIDRPRNGKALAQMIDLAMLTGQRIGDLLKLRWADVTADGIRFIQGKGQGRVRLLVEWSDALRVAIDAHRPAEPSPLAYVLQKESGGPYRYSGIRSAWVRACARAGVEDLHIHDLRGRAGVDALGEEEDMRQAQRLLGHSSERQTRDYVEGKYDRRVRPAK